MYENKIYLTIIYAFSIIFFGIGCFVYAKDLGNEKVYAILTGIFLITSSSVTPIYIMQRYKLIEKNINYDKWDR